MNTHEELLPCPFCGGEAHLFDGNWVECTKCGCQTPEAFEEVVISAWNRRTPPAAVPDGWVLVPKEPTREMAIAAAKALDDITVDDPKAAAWDAMRAYRAMLSAAPTPPVDDGWRPIETAPKDGTQIILLSANGTRQIGWWSEAAGAWSYGGGSWGDNVTKWCPLPPPPGNTEGE